MVGVVQFERPGDAHQVVHITEIAAGDVGIAAQAVAQRVGVDVDRGGCLVDAVLQVSGYSLSLVPFTNGMCIWTNVIACESTRPQQVRETSESYIVRSSTLSITPF